MGIGKDDWLREAMRYADHALCYAMVVPEHSDWFEKAYGEGLNPYVAVDNFADAYDLDRADSMADWGINAGKPFTKVFLQ